MHLNFQIAVPAALLCALAPMGLKAAPQDAAPQAEQQASAAAVNFNDGRLGPDDELTLASPEIPEIDRRVIVVQSDGKVNIPLVGPIQAEGRTPAELQTAICAALKSQFRSPQVSFSDIKTASKSVSVLGAVGRPGVFQIDHDRTLLEMVSLAGGLRNDAGAVIRLARPSTDASSFPTGVRTKLSGDSLTYEVSVADLFAGKNPTENISVLPGDVITVPRGHMVYVVGQVTQGGGFPMDSSSQMTVMRAVSLAGGLASFASTSHARILRVADNGQRVDQEFDLKKVLDGKAEDLKLQADDILFIPDSTAKRITAKAIELSIQSGTSVAIWGR